MLTIIESLIRFDAHRPDLIKKLLEDEQRQQLQQQQQIELAHLQQQNVRSAKTRGQIELKQALHHQHQLHQQFLNESSGNNSNNSNSNNYSMMSMIDSPTHRLIKVYNRLFGCSYLKVVFEGIFLTLHSLTTQQQQQQSQLLTNSTNSTCTQQQQQQQQNNNNPLTDENNSNNTPMSSSPPSPTTTGANMSMMNNNSNNNGSGNVVMMSNEEIIMIIANLLIQNIERSIHVLPHDLRRISTLIFKFHKNLTYLSNVILRHFICHAITLPEHYGLWYPYNSSSGGGGDDGSGDYGSTPNVRQRQILVGVSKLILRLLPSNTNSNSETSNFGSGGSGGDMSDETQIFVERHRTTIQSFLTQLSSSSSNSSNSSTSSSTSSQQQQSQGVAVAVMNERQQQQNFVEQVEVLYRNLVENFCHFPILSSTIASSSSSPYHDFSYDMSSTSSSSSSSGHNNHSHQASGLSHMIRALELKQMILTMGKTRDQFIQIAQKMGKIILPINWIKTQQAQMSTQRLNHLELDYDRISVKQVQKDLQRDSIKINNKLFQNVSLKSGGHGSSSSSSSNGSHIVSAEKDDQNNSFWSLIQYMISMFGYTGMSQKRLAQFILSILQKTGRTSAGGDSFDATMFMFGDHEQVLVTPDSLSMSEQPLHVKIWRENTSSLNNVHIETSLKHFYKITDRNTYHEQHSVWFRVTATVKWRFNLSMMAQSHSPQQLHQEMMMGGGGGSSMMMDAGQVIIEPDASTMETFCKILASCSPGTASSSTTATSSSSSGMNAGSGGTSSTGGGGGKMSYLERLQTMLYAIQVQDRERRRNESFESFLSVHLPN